MWLQNIKVNVPILYIKLTKMILYTNSTNIQVKYVHSQHAVLSADIINVEIRKTVTLDIHIERMI